MNPMKKKNISGKAGHAAENLVFRAERSADRPLVWRWAALVAGVLILAAAVLTRPSLTPAPEAPAPSPSAPSAAPAPSLPLLTPSLAVGGMGFESYMVRKTADLTLSPLTDTDAPATLPVFENRFVRDDAGIVSYPDWEAARTLLEQTAAALGIKEPLNITDNAPSAEEKERLAQKLGVAAEDIPAFYTNPTELRLESKDFTISVEGDLTVLVEWKNPVALPAGMNLKSGASQKQLKAAGLWLLKNHPKLIGFADPQLLLDGGDRNIYGEQLHTVTFHEKGTDTESGLLDFYFNRVIFYGDDAGDLWLCRIYHADLSRKVADYPTITLQQAESRLMLGKYLSTAPEPFPGLALVERAELCYRTGGGESGFIPYYRFYVRLPGWETNGMDTVAAYYVPAIADEYLSPDMVWNGSFN